MKYSLIILLLLILTLNIFGFFIDKDKAEIVANNWYNHNSNRVFEDIYFKDPFVSIYNDNPCFYIFSIEPGGFVIVSADDNIVPVLGYSLTAEASEEIENPATAHFLEKYKKEIYDVIVNTRDNTENKILWQKLLENNFEDYTSNRDVSPLLNTSWDQNWSWNAACPVDNQGPGGHVYAGCVAVAMAQVMKFWAFPTTETGYHSYTHPEYGFLEATFGNYNFSSMQNSYPTTASRELLFHCGVSVDMDYGPYGSGANSNYAEYALKYYFDYSLGLILEYKNSYSQSQWEQILRNELDNGRPMYYAGEDVQYGHAFNCDGYQNTNYFHFNWGWSGYYDGYYYLNNLNPGGYNFSTNQQAIIGIEPPEIAIPPENLEATVMGSDVLLMWEAPSVNRELLGYNVYRDDVNIFYAEGPENTTFFDMGLQSGTYTYYVTSVYDQAESQPCEPVEVTIGTAADDNNIDPALPYLAQNYPNPFRSQTTISFQLTTEHTESTEITIFNIKGQKVKSLDCINHVDAKTTRSLYSITWDGTDENNNPVPAGIYLYKLNSGGFEELRKMVMMQ